MCGSNQKPYKFLDSETLVYGGRLQLIQSLIVSTTYVWLSAFRLPHVCIKERERISAAFLWLVPILNARKEKVSWESVCRPKTEGGLGIRSFKIVNAVCCLRLIWKILSQVPSLWGRWIHTYLIWDENFWFMKRSKIKALGCGGNCLNTKPIENS